MLNKSHQTISRDHKISYDGWTGVEGCGNKDLFSCLNLYTFILFDTFLQYYCFHLLCNAF